MTLRFRMLTTAVLLCHLLLLPKLVSSQARGDARDPQQSPSKPHLAGPNEPGEEITIQASQQEKAGDVYRLRGDVEIRFRRFLLRGDDLTYNTVSGDITATGHVVFDGGPHDEHLEADHATYNVRTDSGKFAPRFAPE